MSNLDRFALQKKIFRTYGMSLGPISPWYHVYRVVILALISTYPLVQLTEFFKVYGRLEDLSAIVTYGSISGISAVKVSLLLYHKKDVVRIMRTFQRDVFATRDKREDDLTSACSNSIKKQTVSYYVSLYVAMVVTCAGALYTRFASGDPQEWKLPFGEFSLADWHQSAVYAYVFAYQTVCIIYSFSLTLCVDMFLVGFLAHIATQFEILQHRIRKFVDAREVTPPSFSVSWERLKGPLKKVVRNHLEVLELAETFESLFNFIILLQFFTSVCSLCFDMFCMRLSSFGDYMFFHYMMGAAELTIEVFIYCYYGNEVFVQSLGVADACNEANYVGTDKRFQKGLAMIMMRSQKPMRLTAGKFAVLSLATFITIMRAAYSYFTVLSTTSVKAEK